MSEGYVLDASVVLAVLLEEPHAAAVEPYLSGAVIGAVNLSEVVAKLQERGMPDVAIDRAIDYLELDVVPFDAEQAKTAGKLRVLTKSYGLSLGDRACLALAKARRVAAVTTDRGWSAVDGGVEVTVARR